MWLQAAATMNVNKASSRPQTFDRWTGGRFCPEDTVSAAVKAACSGDTFSCSSCSSSAWRSPASRTTPWLWSTTCWRPRSTTGTSEFLHLLALLQLSFPLAETNLATLLWPRVGSVIRKLATKALHNLTPRAADYMAATGELCGPAGSSGHGEADGR